ncbi:YhgE/Pip domain-containing protein [Melissococcus plutonius]
MRHINNSFKLFKLDWQRVFKNPIATLLIIALLIIPSLYAWFNIGALWDPYGNTSELPIAIYSDDQTVSLKEKKINIGDEVLKNLHKNKQLGWRFVDSKKVLDDGVKSGKYYAGIYLPREFSKDLMSFVSGDIKKPKIEYSINEKINAIAPKITVKGASSLQEQITNQFIKTASNTLLHTFNEIGYNVDSNLVSINKIKNLILSTNDNVGTIDKYTQEVTKIHSQLPDMKNKLAKANEFANYLPQIDELGEKIIALNGKLPSITQQASAILTLQKKIPDIQNAGKQLAMVDNDFSNVEQTMTEGITEAKEGLQIVQKVQQALPKIEGLTNQASDFGEKTAQGAKQLQDALPGISTSIKTTIGQVQVVTNETVTIVNKLQQALSDGNIQAEKGKINQQITQLQKMIVQQQQANEQLICILENSGDSSLQETITKLKMANAQLTDLNEKLTIINGYVQNGDVTQIHAYLNQISNTANRVNEQIGSINVDEVQQKISVALDKLIHTINSAQGYIDQAKAVHFHDLLGSTQKTISNALSILEKYQSELPAMKKEIHEANTLLNGHMTDIINGINKGADVYNNELPILSKKLNTAADFIKNDYPGIRNDLTNTLTMVNQKMPAVEEALNKANDLIINDWPTLKAGLAKAATAIHKGEQTANLGDIIKLLKLDANRESNFFAQPIDIAQHAIYPIKNNGSSVTPFYTALCLWVGAVLFSSVATTDYY